MPYRAASNLLKQARDLSCAVPCSSTHGAFFDPPPPYPARCHAGPEQMKATTRRHAFPWARTERDNARAVSEKKGAYPRRIGGDPLGPLVYKAKGRDCPPGCSNKLGAGRAPVRRYATLELNGWLVWLRRRGGMLGACVHFSVTDISVKEDAFFFCQIYTVSFFFAKN